MDIGGWSAVGPREANEDNYYTIALPATCSISNGVDTFIMVSDGMGGYQSGDVASSLVAMSAERYIENLVTMAQGRLVELDPQVALQEIVNNAHDAIVAETRARGTANMGATFVGAFISPTHAWIGHVGDSRAYLVEGDEVTQLTEDHSQVGRLLSRGVITEAEAQSHPARNRIERALGFEDFGMDTDEVDLTPRSKLMLCSDGVYTVLAKETLAGLLARGGSAQDSARDIVDAALQAQTDDNSTAVVASMTPSAAPQEKDRSAHATVIRRPLHIAQAASRGTQRTATLRSAPTVQAPAGEEVPAVRRRRGKKNVGGKRVGGGRYGDVAGAEAGTKAPVRPSLGTTILPIAIFLALALAVFLLFKIAQVPTTAGSAQAPASTEAQDAGDSRTSRSPAGVNDMPRDASEQTERPDDRTQEQDGPSSTRDVVVQGQGGPAGLRYIDGDGVAQVFYAEPFGLAVSPALVDGTTVRAEATANSYGRSDRLYRALSESYVSDLKNDCVSYRQTGATQFSSELSRAVPAEEYLALVQGLAIYDVDYVANTVRGLAVLDSDVVSAPASDGTPSV